MASNFRLRLGTRGSVLALWQARYVAERVHQHFPHIEIETVIIKTAGDVRQDVPLSEVAGTGVFVKEIEAALREDRIDFAVHSAKDLPSGDSEGLYLAAFCERGDPRDALISSRYGSLASLPDGATVATGSARRQAQLRAIRPDLNFVSIRGNIDTRLSKLANGDADAIVLALAGLARLGKQAVVSEILEPEVCLPQVGQACVAVQCRAIDSEIISVLGESCDHAITRREVTCERHFLSMLGGGCTMPVAAYAISSDRFLYLFALVASLDGKRILKTRSGSTLDNGRGIAEGAYHSLLEQGAGDLLRTGPVPASGNV